MMRICAPNAARWTGQPASERSNCRLEFIPIVHQLPGQGASEIWKVSGIQIILHLPKPGVRFDVRPILAVDLSLHKACDTDKESIEGRYTLWDSEACFDEGVQHRICHLH